MRVLIAGASGFVGRSLAARLERAGHQVVRAVRRPERAGDIAIDYSADVDVARLAAQLQGIDAAVNAIGILVETRGQPFRRLHTEGPRALFEACARAGVRRVIQVSALGAAAGDTPYFASKRAADEFLMRYAALSWQVVRPALIYGDDGASARMFRLLASVPFVFLPAGGRQKVQPVHIDDVAECIMRLLDPGVPNRQCVDLVGAEPVTFREMLRTYRAAMGFAPALAIHVPGILVRVAAAALGWIPGMVLNRDTWKMLEEGNTGDPSATTKLLGHEPRPLARFIEPGQAPLLRAQALAAWHALALRAAIALLSIVAILALWPERKRP